MTNHSGGSLRQVNGHKEVGRKRNEIGSVAPMQCVYDWTLTLALRFEPAKTDLENEIPIYSIIPTKLNL